MGKIWETTVATCRKHLGNIWEIMRECLKQKVIRIWDMLRHFLWTSGIEMYWFMFLVLRVHPRLNSSNLFIRKLPFWATVSPWFLEPTGCIKPEKDQHPGSGKACSSRCSGSSRDHKRSGKMHQYPAGHWKMHQFVSWKLQNILCFNHTFHNQHYMYYMHVVAYKQTTD